MSHSTVSALALSLTLVAACSPSGTGSSRTPGGPSGEGVGAATASRPPASSASDWIDPEPPDAQALAQSVLGAAWNADKTTRLTMRISPLVDRTSGLAGFASNLASRAATVDERLARLGAIVTDTAVTIRLPGAILFDFDSAELRADAEPMLGEVAAIAAALGSRPLRVEGHTDAIASEAYNQRLSEQRAAAVVDWLKAHGVATARLTAVGRGETAPVATNDDAEGRQRNRRVEVVILKS